MKWIACQDPLTLSLSRKRGEATEVSDPQLSSEAEYQDHVRPIPPLPSGRGPG